MDPDGQPMEAEKKANPGTAHSLRTGFNFTRSLVLFGFEVRSSGRRRCGRSARRRAPRVHRGGIYPFIRGAMCVVVRDLIVYGVLTDMMRAARPSTPPFRATTRSRTTRVLERADPGGAAQARPAVSGASTARAATRLGPTRSSALRPRADTGATFKQRNGYGLDELVERSLEHGSVRNCRRRRAACDGRLACRRGDGEHQEREALEERRFRTATSSCSARATRLVSLMEEPRRLTLEEIDDRHPRLIPALREHPHVGCCLSGRPGAARSRSVQRERTT